MSTPQINRNNTQVVQEPDQTTYEDPTLIDVINAKNVKAISVEPLGESIMIEPQAANKTTYVADKTFSRSALEEGAVLANIEKEAVKEAVLIKVLEKDASGVFLNSAFKGVADSVFVTGAVYPVEAITTKVQLSGAISKKAGPLPLSEHNEKRPSGFNQVRNLYKGYGLKTTANIPAGIGFYWVYNESNSYVKKNWAPNPVVSNTISLPIATLVDVALYNPFSLVLTRLQAGDPVNPENTKNAVAVLKKILQEEQVNGNLFKTSINLAKASQRGFVALYFRNVTFLLPYFTLLDLIQTTMAQGKKDIPAGQQLIDSIIAGLISGLFSACISFPFDRISKEQKYSSKPAGFIELTSEILKKEGVGGFYKGALTGILVRQLIYGVTTAVVLKSVDLGLEEHQKYKAERAKNNTSASDQKNLINSGEQIDFANLDEIAEGAKTIKDSARATYNYFVKMFDKLDNKFPIIVDTLELLWDKVKDLHPFQFSKPQPEFNERRDMGPFKAEFFKKPSYISKVTKIEEIKEDGSTHALDAHTSFDRIASSASLF
jgi:hypothetical protein